MTAQPSLDPSKRQELLVEGMLRHLALLDDANASRLSWAAFWDLRTKLAKAELEWTTLSLTMCRLLFALSCCHQPRSLLVLGSHVGFAAAWLLRDRADGRCGAPVQSFDGVDPDRSANVRARRNCELLGHVGCTRIHDETGQSFLRRNRGAFDIVLIDIDEPVAGKAAYAELLKLASPQLSPGALVLGHDPLVPRFAEDIAAFHEAIETDPSFEGPWVLPVDDCGLTLARRR